MPRRSAPAIGFPFPTGNLIALFLLGILPISATSICETSSIFPQHEKFRGCPTSQEELGGRAGPNSEVTKRAEIPWPRRFGRWTGTLLYLAEFRTN